MIVRLGYTMSVDVLVDLNEGKVRSVVSLGETLDPSDEAWDENGDQVSADIGQRAHDIADSAEWPVWEKA